jgi:hypothetical protein
MSPYEVLLEIRRQIRGSQLSTDEIPVHVRAKDWNNNPTSRDACVELRIKDSNGKLFIVSVREA